jgi:5-oxoprolinase (ATP-hydrolysing) subunit A
MVAIDLNSDLGESYGAWKIGDDAAMLGIVTSANVACGFHAGDPSVLRAACLAAAANGVAIGAQVSYPDLVGFGRRFVDMEPNELRDAVLYQFGALDAFAQVAGSEIVYVKAHGALYHATATQRRLADAVVAAAVEYDPSMAVLGLPESELSAAADDAGLEFVTEAFADRAYRPDGGLVSRREAGSVLDDPTEIAERAVRLAVDNEVEAVDGSVVSVRARSLCVHSDTPGAVEIARSVREALDAAGVGVRRFTDE